MTIRQLISPLLAAMLAAAAPLAAAVNCPAVTVVGVSDLGYSGFQEHGKVRGAGPDMVAELGRRTGCKFELRWFPRGRLFAQFDSGRLDMTTSSVSSRERNVHGQFAPYAYTRFELLLHKDVKGTFSSLTDFVDRSQARLNIVRGPQVNVQLERLRQAGRLEEVNDYDVVFKKMAARRTDGTLAPPVLYQWHTQRHGNASQLVMVAIPESPAQLVGMYFSRDTLSAEVRQAYTQALRSIVEDGTVLKIYGRYVSQATVRRVFEGGIRATLEAQPEY